MQARPDPLRRLALLRHNGLTSVVDVPVSAIDGDDERAGPAVEAIADADVMSVRDDVRSDAEETGRPRRAEGPPAVTGAPGRHRHQREDTRARADVGDRPTAGSDINSAAAFSALGGWVPDDDRGDWEGYDNLEPQLRAPSHERRTLTRRRDATGDDAIVNERDDREPPGGNRLVDFEHTDDSERDDSAAKCRTRSDVDRAGGGGDPGGGDGDNAGADDNEGDGDGGDGGDWDGQAGKGGDGGVGDGGGGDGGAGGDGDGEDGEERDGDELADSDELNTPRIHARRLGNRPWGRLAELWVPESLRDARIDPGRRGLLVLLLVAAVAAVATAIGVWRDRPEPRPVETVALAPAANGTGLAALAPVANPADPPTSGAAPISATAAISGTGAAMASAPPTEVVVSVTGLVAHPGVVTLPAGARVTDAIAAAGGSTAEADLTGLNLAAKLVDGDSVVIAGTSTGAGNSGVTSAGSAHSLSPGNPAAAGGQQTSSPLIDLNTADETALDSLPGVGPVMAQNILAWRRQNGRFNTVEQLQEISGIGPARYAQISALVTVS